MFRVRYMMYRIQYSPTIRGNRLLHKILCSICPLHTASRIRSHGPSLVVRSTAISSPVDSFYTLQSSCRRCRAACRCRCNAVWWHPLSALPHFPCDRPTPPRPKKVRQRAGASQQAFFFFVPSPGSTLVQHLNTWTLEELTDDVSSSHSPSLVPHYARRHVPLQ